MKTSPPPFPPCRLGLLNDLGDNFDPTSTREPDIHAFRNCVLAFQQFQGVGCRHGGLLCAHTIASISECLLGKSQVHSDISMM